MIFADKLIRLRKKMGLSQEELAFKMNVSRQAVSKWESTQSIPDLDNVLQLSTLFNVSTDFLLKDELESEALSNEEPLVRVVLLEEVNDYLEHVKKTALKTALGTLFCILSPLILIVLSILSDESIGFIKPELAVIIGIVVLFLFVMAGVTLFIASSFKEDRYTYITKKDFKLEYGAISVIRDKKGRFRNRYNAGILIGVILCISSPIALLITAFMNNLYAILVSISSLLVMISIAVFMFIYICSRWSGFERVSQEAVEKASGNKKEKIISKIIWSIATILYLSVSIIFGYWHLTWIIWVIAAAVQSIVFVLFKEE